MSTKPLNGKAYGHIGHLPNSRMGPADRHCHPGQMKICTVETRDRHDVVTVTEKVDGTNVAVARLSGEKEREHGPVCALIRAGWPAVSSKREMHRLFALWVAQHHEMFADVLNVGESLHGEWLAQAHGTLYDLDDDHPPFIAFDLMCPRPPGVSASKGNRVRMPYGLFERTCRAGGITKTRLLHAGGAISVDAARRLLERNHAGHATRDGELQEGVVYRVERMGEFDFLAKWVDPRKVDGKYLPDVAESVNPGQSIWLWRPAKGETGE